MTESSTGHRVLDVVLFVSVVVGLSGLVALPQLHFGLEYSLLALVGLETLHVHLWAVTICAWIVAFGVRAYLQSVDDDGE